MPVRERLIPKAGRQAPQAGDRHRSGPGRPSRPEAGARADLRGGLPAVLATASARSAGPRTRSPRSTSSPPAPMSGCWRVTSRRASTRSHTRRSMDRVRRRIGDKRVLGLVKAFLKAGILAEDGRNRDNDHRHPPRRDSLTRARQHRPLRPRRAFRRGLGVDGRLQRTRARRRKGLANYRLVRYADDFVVMVAGHPSRRREPARRGGSGARSDGSAPRRRRRRGSSTSTRASTSWAGASSVTRSEARTKTLRLHLPVEEGAARRLRQGADDHPQGPQHLRSPSCSHRLNPVLRGWTNYFRHGVSKATFSYLDAFAWRRVGGLASPQTPRAQLEAGSAVDYLPGWRPTEGKATLFNPAKVHDQPLPLPGEPNPHTRGRAHMERTVV